MELESVSKISCTDYCNFFRFVNLKTGWKKLLIPINVILLIMIVFSALVIALYEFSSAVILEILLAILIAFLLIHITFIMPYMTYKSSANIYSIDNYFNWYDDHFSVKFNKNGIDSNTTYKYDSLLKAYEVNDFLYLFIAKSQAHLIPKNSFTKGTWMELSSVLKNALGDRYKVSK